MNDFEISRLAQVEALLDIERRRINDLESALRKIACFDDKQGNEHLENTGSYGAFDEPYAVEIARKVLGEA
jgi:hypothetical protein